MTRSDLDDVERNPYRSPASVDEPTAEPRSSPSADEDTARDRPALARFQAIDWGKLTPVWTVAFLFGFVMFLGSAGTYILLLALPDSLKQSLSPRHPYDAAGYISFITCSLIAIVTGVVSLRRQPSTLSRPWPDWREPLKSFVDSTILMAPVWVLYGFIADGTRHALPGDGNWVAISVGAFWGIVHAGLWQRGLRLRWPREQRLENSPDG